MTISVVQLGRVDYATGLRIQQRLVELRKAGEIGDVLLLLEHTPVITLGRNAKASNVLASADLLAMRGVEIFETDRGGDVTFHGPGQLVAYPIFDLRGFSRQPSAVSHREIRPEEEPEKSWLERRGTLGAVDYVRRLEEVLIRTCGEFEIATERVKGLTGVWTGQGQAFRTQAKIAAIGVHISRGVTSHGFALNVNTDLRYFDLIVPCGITTKPVTSIEKELGRQTAIESVAEKVARNFGKIFGRKIVNVEALDALVGNAVGVPMKAPHELREIRGEEEIFLA
jgi:lipoyl(octanoyl) transferase